MIIAKLLANTVIDNETGCWLWTLYKDGKGYGRTRYRGKIIRVHRLSLIIQGVIEEDSLLHALHKKECPNRNCWNPEHLYAGTEEDNTRDKVELGHVRWSKKRARLDTCIHGHDIGNLSNCYFNNRGSRTCKICKHETYLRKINCVRT